MGLDDAEAVTVDNFTGAIRSTQLTLLYLTRLIVTVIKKAD